MVLTFVMLVGLSDAFFPLLANNPILSGLHPEKQNDALIANLKSEQAKQKAINANQDTIIASLKKQQEKQKSMHNNLQAEREKEKTAMTNSQYQQERQMNAIISNLQGNLWNTI